MLAEREYMNREHNDPGTSYRWRNYSNFGPKESRKKSRRFKKVRIPRVDHNTLAKISVITAIAVNVCSLTLMLTR